MCVSNTLSHPIECVPNRSSKTKNSRHGSWGDHQAVGAAGGSTPGGGGCCVGGRRASPASRRRCDRRRSPPLLVLRWHLDVDVVDGREVPLHPPPPPPLVPPPPPPLALTSSPALFGVDFSCIIIPAPARARAPPLLPPLLLVGIVAHAAASTGIPSRTFPPVPLA